MTALLQYITHGRLADLNPFDMPTAVKGRAVTPGPALPDTNAPTRQARTEAEFGCVDWYQYPYQADEPKAAH